MSINTIPQEKRNSLKFLLIALLGMLVTANNAICQSVFYNTGLHAFFDNREYFNPYSTPQTIFGARTYIYGGFKLDENQCFAAGVDYLYEFGESNQTGHINPIIYFNHNQKGLNLYIGSFPRKDIIDLPLILQTDTFQYYRPNVEGIFMEYKNSWLSQNIWLDWTSRQTKTDKEAFLVGGSGRVILGRYFFMEEHFILMHDAVTALDGEDEHIRDNGGVIAGIGVDLSGRLIFDTLDLFSSFSYSFDQHRGIYEVKHYGGSYSRLNMGFKRLRVSSHLYLGDGQVQLVGDPSYTSEFYSRSDIILRLFDRESIHGEVCLSIHLFPGIIDLGQSFRILIDFGKSFDIGGRSK